MYKPGWTLIASVVCVTVTGCTDKPMQTASKEDVLTASGFKVVSANTPERQAAMARLPPHKIVRQVRGDKTVYVYADPTVCGCLYVGKQTAYNAYRTRVAEKQITEEQDLSAMNKWDWSPWAFGYPSGWPYE
jgi:hypothetical protein